MSGYVFGEVDSRDVTAPFSTAITPGGGADVATTSTPIVAANANRKQITITNGSDTDMWLTLAAAGAAVGNGHYLKAGGGSFTEAWAGAVCAVHTGASGTKRAGFVEY